MARIHLGPLDRALVVEEPDPSLDTKLEADGFSVHRVAGKAPAEAELIALLQQTGAQVLFKRSRVPVTRAVIESCPELLLVQLCCIGDDSVDKQACADHGVMVLNDPVSNGRSVVELAVGHLIGLSRRVVETDRACRAGVWEKTNVGRYEIKGKVLGVVGMGNIGRATARACEALGMRIRFYDSRQVALEVGEELGWTACPSIEEVFRGSDCVSVHLSARDVNGHSNDGRLTREILGSLGAERPADSPRIFLNLARGFLHTTEDLLAAVASGAVRRAAVDVYPSEPRGTDDDWVNPYAAEPRIVVSPHIGASTREAQPRIARRVADTVDHFSRWGRLRDCVFAPRSRLALMEDGPVGGAMLAVAHSTARGTKRAVDEAIYAAGASNLSSTHKDFRAYGMAYELALLDRPLDASQLAKLVTDAGAMLNDEHAIRSIRQVVIG